MNKKEFIDKWGCEPDEEAPAFVQEIDSKNHAEFLEDLDQFEQHIKEECAKEMIQRIKSLFEPKTHGVGRTTIGERKGLKLL